MKRFAMTVVSVWLLSVVQPSYADEVAKPTSAESATNVKITWQDMEKFTDIRPTSSTRASFRRHIQTSFDKIWQRLAKDMPAGYQLQLVIKDMDLAGDVNPLFRVDNQDVRVIKEIYFPRITLDYQLLNSEQQVVLAAKDVKIKDMNFMTNLRLRNANQSFGYETSMLERWYKDTIKPVLPAKQ